MGERRTIKIVPFTRAQNLPEMIGEFWGYDRWPFPLTVFQFCVCGASMVGLLRFWHLWARFGMANYLIYPGLVAGATWLSRHVRIQGQAPWAAGLGLLEALSGRPKLNGLPFKPMIETRYRERRMLLMPGPGWKRRRFAIVTAKHSSGLRQIHVHRNYWQRRAS